MINPKIVSESGDAGKTVEAGDIRILSDFNHTVYLAPVSVHSCIFIKYNTIFSTIFDYAAGHSECTAVKVHAAEVWRAAGPRKVP